MVHSAFEGILIDRVQEYWNNRPCNIRHSQAPIGTRQYFDEVEARKYFVDPHIPAFAQFDCCRQPTGHPVERKFIVRS